MRAADHQRPGAAIAAVVWLGLWAVPATGQSRTYTLDAHFDEGTLINVHHDSPHHDQLQLKQESTPYRFLNIATVHGAGPRIGTIVRIDVDTGEVIGEYLTAPAGRLSNPSRTTVDALGNVWAGNRDEPFQGTYGSVVKVGLVVGGTRVDASGQPDPDGQYLKPPFDYSTAVDRDGDGLIRTSRGLGDILEWPDVTDGTGGSGGGPALVEDALDELVLIYQRTNSPNIRHLSVDPQNDIWVGGYPYYATSFEKLDGDTGMILDYFDSPGCGGYGGLVDENGVLWSTSKVEDSLLRYDPANPGGAECLPIPHSYGLGIDSQGFIWNSQRATTSMAKIAPDGTILFKDKPIPGAGALRGVAVTTADDNVWVADSGIHAVFRLDSNGDVLGGPIAVGAHPTGICVDTNGKVWVTCKNSSNVYRIDPDLGTNGQVDMIVPLTPHSEPYNYSDMTGAVVFGSTLDVGYWEVIYDCGIDATSWGTASWNCSEPNGATITVEVRAADNVAGLPGLTYVPVTSGSPFSMSGRYLQARTTLAKSPTTNESPILYDLTLAALPSTDCIATHRREPGSLLLYPEFDNLNGVVSLVTVTNTLDQDVNVEFVYIDAEDCSEFNRSNTLTGNDTLSLLTESHNPNMELGFMYLFAKSQVNGDPVVHNGLIGQLMRVDGLEAFEYAVDAVSFAGIGDGTYTDLDSDGVRDLDGEEYTMVPDELLIPRFLGQSAPGNNLYKSNLILIALTGGKHFQTTIEFLIYNDNEEEFSSEYTFSCWDDPLLVEISGIFQNQFLRNSTNHDPNEILGFPTREAGWFRIDGLIAQSSAHSIEDPAIYAVLVERAASYGAADLPFELCSQDNGDLMAHGLYGDF